jgi:phosphoenolpyruvate carboxylase
MTMADQDSGAKRASLTSGAAVAPAPSSSGTAASGRPSARAKDNERPLVEDIRLLGRLLGDVIREQEGVAAYELIEQVRKLSVAFRRDADAEADKALKKLLKGLSADQTVSVIRAFTYFSHLANLAEDRHHIRRRAVHERAGDTQEGSIEVALARLRWAGISPKTIANTLAHSYVSPVLTAHPTEVQRKSILDAERDIAQLLVARDEIKLRARWPVAQGRAHAARAGRQRGPAALAHHAAVADAAACASASSRWSTKSRRAELLRGDLPARDPQALCRAGTRTRQARGASFLRMGQWIGGDRDGNPNVSAQTLEYAMRRQCEVALRHYLTELFWLGSELSLSAMLVRRHARDAGAGRKLARHQRAPAGRALPARVTGMYARLAATLKELTGGDAARHAVPPQNPMCAPKTSWPTCAPSRLRCGAPRARAGAAAPASADARGGSVRLPPGHGGPAPKLRPARRSGGRTAVGGAHRADYSALDEAGKRELLLRLLNDARPLRVVGAAYSEHARKELAIFEMARTVRARYGPQAIRHYIISHTEAVSDLLEVMLLQKEVGLMQGTLDDKARTT